MKAVPARQKKQFRLLHIGCKRRGEAQDFFSRGDIARIGFATADLPRSTSARTDEIRFIQAKLQIILFDIDMGLPYVDVTMSLSR
jgi:hypothetical protein